MQTRPDLELDRRIRKLVAAAWADVFRFGIELLKATPSTALFRTNSIAQPLAIPLSVPSAMVGVVLGFLITGVPLGLITFLVALTRIVVRVLYLVVFEIRQDNATLTEPIPAPQSCTR